MENLNAFILPRVLQMVNNTPDLCQPLDNVCVTIKRCLAAETNGPIRFTKVDKAVKEALKVGENLGIVMLKEDMVKLPFKINSGVPMPRIREAVEVSNSNLEIEDDSLEDENAEDEEVEYNPPASTSSAMPSRQMRKQSKKTYYKMKADPEGEDESAEDESAEDEELDNGLPASTSFAISSGQRSRKSKKQNSRMNDDPEDCYGRGTMRQRRAGRPKRGKSQNRSRSRSSRRRGSRRRRS
ncbi:uncharacterized protein LOC106089229 [Stomoxys calcitrans]|uniref:uncharacterized protein LOC106089229 n=1 Tax=Stomoxys calcitrans TaxID=35570 RepID=UPI0027E38412|nr:uncharacterized protein LOC106089229 [Stomoxys calcitrans]